MEKKKIALVGAAAVVSVFMMVSWALGSGFALFEGSAKGNAMGGLTGSADVPSAMFYNPAGMTQLPGLQMSAGGTAVFPSVDVKASDPYTGAVRTQEAEDNTWLLPHLYTSYQATDSVWFGLAVFSRFGLGSEFDENWWGRYNSYKAIIKTATINPNVAWKINDMVSVAAGFDMMWFDLLLKNRFDGSRFLGNPQFNDPQVNLFDVDSRLSGDSWGYGFNLAVHLRPAEWLRFGASYRSSIKQDVDGNAEFLRVGALSSQLPGAWFNDTAGGGSIKLPDMLFFGTSVSPMKRLHVELGATYTRWSTYDQLVVNYDQPIVVIPGHLTLSSVTIPKNWKDVWRFNIGVEYETTPWLDLRASYLYDQTPIPGSSIDYIVPADNRHMVGLGAGFHWGAWGVDVTYNYLWLEDRDVSGRPEDGVYDGRIENGDSHFVALTANYRF